MNISFDRFRHPQKQGCQGDGLVVSDDHWSLDDAARWALRRDQEERARKRARWIAAAIVFTAFILVATVLLAQDNPEAGTLTPGQQVFTKAEKYRLAAEQGDAEAQFNLGVMYDTGGGVLKDKAEAVRWFRLAAEQGDAAAQGLLGHMYALGRGVRKDYVHAHMWLNIASANGAKKARKVRDFLEDNHHMTRDEIRRAIELARACMTSDYQDCEP